jgi:formylglycine-generating enzyme required for sulfatase activity
VTIGVALSVVLLFVGLVSVLAVPVRVRVEPPPDELSLSDSLFQLRLGERSLLREGRHLLRARLEGYASLETEYVVADAPSQEFVFRLSPLPGRVEVRTQPVSGVGLLVDGERRETSPVDLELAAGPHRIELDGGPRFQAASVDFEVEGLGANQELLLTLTPAWAEVSVRSKPPGAEVLVDGEPAGVTPTVLELLAGEHRLELHHPDFKSVAQRVTVEANTPLELPEVVLGAAPGRAAIESRPSGATVTVNDNYRGKTPIEVTLDPGDHSVQLHKPGHRRASRSMRVASKETSRISIPLEPIRGVVEVRVEPVDAVVSVDGREVGRGSQTLELLATSHVIEVSKPGYGTERLTVTTHEDLRGRVEVTLQTLAAIREANRPKAIDTAAGRIVLVRPGSFQMGASRREPERRANEVLHDVELTRPFYIGTREVTNAEFRVFAPGHESASALGSLDADELPVVGVSWADAARFCNWLSNRDGLPPTYVEQGGTLAAARPLTTGYRLPLEAEWAWVARYGGGERGEAPRYPWGDEFPPRSGTENYADLSAQGTLTNLIPSYRDDFPTTAPAAEAAVGPLGLRGLGGNVSEWMHDRYGIPRTAPVRDPTGSASGETHVIRGGSWRDWSPAELRLTFRDHGSDGRDDVGFRIARYAD